MPVPEVSNGNNSIKKGKNPKKSKKPNRSTWPTHISSKYTSSKTVNIRKDRNAAEVYMNKSKKVKVLADVIKLCQVYVMKYHPCTM